MFAGLNEIHVSFAFSDYLLTEQMAGEFIHKYEQTTEQDISEW